MSKELPGFSSRAVQLPPTPSGLVLGTKLGTVELTPGGAERPPVFENFETCVAREWGKNHRAAGSAILCGPVCHESASRRDEARLLSYADGRDRTARKRVAGEYATSVLQPPTPSDPANPVLRTFSR